MSDERIADIPTPGNSRHITTDPPPAADWPNATAPQPKRSSVVWLCVPVVYTFAAAAAFVYICWLMSSSVNGDLRMLAGPVLLFRTEAVGDKVFGIGTMAFLLPCIFAVGVRRSAVTLVLCVFGCLAWLALGVWIEAMASV